MPNKLFLLKRIDEANYDENFGFLIRAESKEEARKIASENIQDESADTWLNSDLSTCDVMKWPGEKGILLRSFKAG